tara:strand:+ start:504 stop:2549 length:2046 start_codon:yes stop_codon:yes gene_type:complete
MEMFQKDARAEAIQDTFEYYSESRSDWENEARDDLDFYLGNHFDSQEEEYLSSINQGSYVIDRIYPAVEQLKSMLTAKTPKFTAIGREDSDNKLAMVWRTILEYVWDVSDGDVKFKEAIHDYATIGAGYLYAYLDPQADMGRGEIKFTSLNPFRVYVDPASRDRYLKDASSIIVSTILTEEQLIQTYPKLIEPDEEGNTLLEGIEPYNEGVYSEDDFPSSSKSNRQVTFTPDVVKNYQHKGNKTPKRYRLLEHYSKVHVTFYRVENRIDGTEKIFDEAQMAEFSSSPEGKKLLSEGFVDFVPVKQPRVMQVCALGQIILYEYLLNTDIFPVVPIPNIWTNTPYPKSDVSKCKDIQRLINKLFSLTLSHAQTSAGLKLIVPQGSVEDIQQLEQDWANPNAVIEVDNTMGEPHFASPQPLNRELFGLINQNENYIDLTFGIPELLHGIKPEGDLTVKGTSMLHEFGSGRGKSKLRDVEQSLIQLGRVIYQLAKSHYSFKKVFRVVQPNNDVSEETINLQLVDPKTDQIQSIKNDLSIGQHDVKIVPGSTLPSNRHQEWSIYLEAYKLGLIDKVEALKKSEIFDKEGILQREGEMKKMAGMIQQLQDQVKSLSGDLQTAQRESVQDRKRVEVEKFKTRLKGDELDGRARTQRSLDKLETEVKLQVQKSQMESNAQNGGLNKTSS